MFETIALADFLKVEIRVGLVTQVRVPEWSEKLLELKVNFGTKLGERTIFSGVRKYYNEADFLNKKFPFVINLAARKMGPSVSQGMMLMVDNPSKPILIPLSEQAELGAVLC